MKLSTRSRYGLKAVIDLAIAYGTGPVSLPVLAGSQGISEGYLEQLLRELKKGSVVDTVRGAQGGYELTCDPAELSVQRVLNLLEGSTAIVDCVGTLHHNCTSACSCSGKTAVSQAANADQRRAGAHDDSRAGRRLYPAESARSPRQKHLRSKV